MKYVIFLTLHRNKFVYKMVLDGHFMLLLIFDYLTTPGKGLLDPQAEIQPLRGAEEERWIEERVCFSESDGPREDGMVLPEMEDSRNQGRKRNLAILSGSRLKSAFIDLFDILDGENAGRTGEKTLFFVGFHPPPGNLRLVGNVQISQGCGKAD
jgi:hypothetical protein